MEIILILAFVIGIFSYMVKSGVFNVDKSEQDNPGSVIDNSDRMDSLGTQGVVGLPGSNDEQAELRIKDLLNKQKYLRNRLYSIEGNPDKMGERCALKVELNKIEKELNNQ